MLGSSFFIMCLHVWERVAESFCMSTNPVGIVTGSHIDTLSVLRHIRVWFCRSNMPPLEALQVSLAPSVRGLASELLSGLGWKRTRMETKIKGESHGLAGGKTGG